MGTERSSEPVQRDLVVAMGRLARLRDADALTEEEFQQFRVKVVDRWTPHIRAPRAPTPPPGA
jgi:hypothetical protein